MRKGRDEVGGRYRRVTARAQGPRQEQETGTGTVGRGGGGVTSLPLPLLVAAGGRDGATLQSFFLSLSLCVCVCVILPFSLSLQLSPFSPHSPLSTLPHGQPGGQGRLPAGQVAEYGTGAFLAQLKKRVDKRSGSGSGSGQDQRQLPPSLSSLVTAGLPCIYICQRKLCTR